MALKGIVLLIIVIILYCLGSALYHLVRAPNQGKQTVTALTWRIILSVSLFVFLLLAYSLGWIHPHGIMG